MINDSTVSHLLIGTLQVFCKILFLSQLVLCKSHESLTRYKKKIVNLKKIFSVKQIKFEKIAEYPAKLILYSGDEVYV